MSINEAGSTKRRSDKLRTRLIIALVLFIFPLLVTSTFLAAGNMKLVPPTPNSWFQTGPGFTPIAGNGSENQYFPYIFLNLPNLSFPSVPFNLDEILLAIVIVIALGLFLPGLIRRSKHDYAFKKKRIQEDRLEVASILDDAAAKLNLGFGYRETVLRCYELISKMVEKKFEIDGRALTAREFRKMVSDTLEFDSPYLTNVTDLFERARYSLDEITEAEALSASDCLSKLSTSIKDISKRTVPTAEATA